MSKKKQRKFNQSYINNPDKPKIMKINYHVTSQTAYHIRKIAMEYGISEGRVVDKLMRSWLNDRRTTI